MGSAKRQHKIWSALVFNAALAAAPLVGVEAWKAAERAGAYGYHASANARVAARAALDEGLARLVPDAGDRKHEWSLLVARALNAGDPVVARGLVLAAPAALNRADAAALETRLPAEARDDQIEAAALDFLDPEVALAYQPGAARAGYAPQSDWREIALAAQSWAQGRPTDELSLILAAYAASGRDAQAAVGAAALRFALRNGRLQQPFLEAMRARAFAAVTPQRFQREADAALRAAPGDEGPAVARAFAASLDAAGEASLIAALRPIAVMTAATSPGAAARLLAHARNAEDLPRLAFLAENGRERALALGDLAGAAALRAAARPTFEPDGATVRWLIAGAGVLLAMLLATLAAVLPPRAPRKAAPAPPVQPAAPERPLRF